MKVDFTFSIHPVALAIAHMLESYVECNPVLQSKKSDRNWNLKTYPWYNGREKGILLCLARIDSTETLCVTFGENRNSDDIFVDHWLINSIRLNPPNVENFTDNAYQGRTSFGFNHINEATSMILDTLIDYVKTSEQGKKKGKKS